MLLPAHWPPSLGVAASSFLAPIGTLLPPDVDANVIVPCILGPLFLLLCEYAQSPTELNKIFVRPGVGAYGVGLLAIQPVPRGGVICTCSAQAVPIRSRRLNLLRPSVRNTVLELYDGWDGLGNHQVGSENPAAPDTSPCTIHEPYVGSTPRERLTRVPGMALTPQDRPGRLLHARHGTEAIG